MNTKEEYGLESDEVPLTEEEEKELTEYRNEYKESQKKGWLILSAPVRIISILGKKYSKQLEEVFKKGIRFKKRRRKSQH